MSDSIKYQFNNPIINTLTCIESIDKKHENSQIREGEAYGIDLGTTFSCIAIVDSNGNPKVISNSDGESITSSVVAFPPKGRTLVGNSAKKMLLNNDEPNAYCIKCIKRRMGEDDTLTINGNDYLPEDISAEILKRLVIDANTSIGKSIKDVVITVPAYFGYKERTATKKAGEMAGLRVQRLISEPTAAAIGYVKEHCVNARENRIIMIYDLGGGTFDVSIVEICGTSVRVLAVDGDQHLGGEDWNERLKEYVISEFQKITNCNKKSIETDPTYEEIDSNVEAAKRLLTNLMVASVDISANDITKKIEVSVEKFEKLTRDLLQITKYRVEDTIKSACQKLKRQYGFSIIDDVVLVGGSSNMRQVKELFKKEFRINPNLYEPELIVAKGAAIVAQQITSMRNDELKDVSSKTYGVGAIDNEGDGEFKISNILFRNSEIPATKKKRYVTLMDNQQEIEIEVYESNAVVPENFIYIEDGKLIDNYTFKLPSSLPKDSPIFITMELDENQILKLTAKDMTKGETIERIIYLEPAPKLGSKKDVPIKDGR